MTNTVVANGHTYTDDDNPTTGMGQGGFRQRLVPMMSDVMHDTNVVMASSAASATAAATSAASALAAPGTNALTNGTPIVPNIGPVGLIVQTGKSFVVGGSVKVASQTDGTTWVFGDILGYNATTGELDVYIQRFNLPVGATQINGVCVVSLSGPAYIDGPVGGVTTSAMSTDLTLTVFSGRLVVVSPTQAGLSVIMPDATTLQTGPDNQFVIRNTPVMGQAFDVAVRDSTGTLLGFAPPSGEVQLNVADNSTAAGTYGIRGISPIGASAFGALTLGASAGGTGGTFIKAYPAAPGTNDNLTMLLLHGTGVHAVLYDESTKTFGPPALILSGPVIAGGDGNVVGVASPGGFLVASLITSTTVLQTVLLQISGLTLTVGTATATTLTTAAVRLVSLDGLYAGCVLAYASASSLFIMGINVSGASPVVGTQTANATTGSAAVLPYANPTSGAATFIVLTTQATTVTAKGYSMTGGVLTAGTAVTTVATTSANVKLGLEYSSGAWPIAFINTTAKTSLVSMTGTVPTFSTPVTVSSVATIASIMAVGIMSGMDDTAGMLVVTTGTDSSSRFICDITLVDTSGAIIGSALRRSFLAAPTATNFGQNSVSATPTICVALCSTKETALYTLNSATAALLSESRTGLTSATQPVAQDPNYLRQPFSRNTIQRLASGQAATLGDGSKTSLLTRGQGVLASTSANLPVADFTLGAHSRRYAASSGLEIPVLAQVWSAFNQGPDVVAYIQRLEIA